MTVRVEGGRPLRGTVHLPGDALVAQRALALAVLANGESRIAGLTDRTCGAALRSTIGVLRALGAEIELGEGGTTIRGRGLRGLSAPAGALDAGASPTAYAIAVGLLSGQPFGTRVLLDAAHGKTTRGQIVEALRARGAMVAEGSVHAQATGAAQTPAGQTKSVARASTAVAPLLEGESLAPIEWILRAPDADAKTAILLSGLFATGSTAVAEPLLSADHTERFMLAMGVPVRRFGTMAGFDAGEWSGELSALGDIVLPGDTAIASVVAMLGCAIDGSHLVLEDVGFNPTRTGVLDALRLCGARFSAMARGDVSGNEPIARIEIKSGALRSAPIGGELAVRAGDAQSALGILAACAARAVVSGSGTGPARRGATLHDPALFTALPPDAFAQMAELLAAFGVDAAVEHDTLHVPVAATREIATLIAPLDVGRWPELGLFALMLALLGPGPSVLQQMPDLDERWPGLLGVLTQLGAQVTIEPTTATTETAATSATNTAQDGTAT